MPITAQQMQQYIQKYAPIVHFHADEKFFPSSVDWYLQRVKLLDARTNKVTQEPPLSATSLPSGAEGTNFRLKIPSDADGTKRGDLSTAKTYVHFLRLPGATEVYEIQYWFFYPFNGPGTAHFDAPLGGSSDASLAPLGEHQGDWEHISVRINDQGQFIGSYFSQHDGGTWYRQASAPDAKDGVTLTESGQVKVYAGLNGHASYPDKGNYKVAGSPHNFLVVSFWIKDRAGNDVKWNTSQSLEVIAVDAPGLPAVPRPAWLNFTGLWGPDKDQELSSESVGEIMKSVMKAIGWLAAIVFPVITAIAAGLAAVILPLIKIWNASGPTTPSNKEAWTGEKGGLVTEPQALPGQDAARPPTRAIFRNQHYLFYANKGDKEIRYVTSADGTSWGSPITIGGEASESPVPVVFQKGDHHRLYLFWVDKGSSKIRFKIFDGASWSSHSEVPDERAGAQPGLASYGGKLYLAFRGDSDSKLFYKTFDPDAGWSARVKFEGEESDQGPSLAVADNTLYVAFKGKDSDKIFYKSFDGNAWSPRQFIPDVTTTASPQLVLVQNVLYAVYLKEGASKISYNYLGDTGWSPQVKLNGAGTSDFIGVAAGANTPLYIAFHGEDTSRIWYATLYV